MCFSIFLRRNTEESQEPFLYFTFFCFIFIYLLLWFYVGNVVLLRHIEKNVFMYHGLQSSTLSRKVSLFFFSLLVGGSLSGPLEALQSFNKAKERRFLLGLERV